MSNTRTVLLTDHSIASLTGSSQSLVSQDMTRSYLEIFNPGTDNVGVNLTGGTASIGGAGTDTILPNGSMIYNTGSIPGNAITVIGTSGQVVNCKTSP